MNINSFRTVRHGDSYKWGSISAYLCFPLSIQCNKISALGFSALLGNLKKLLEKIFSLTFLCIQITN